MRALLCLTAFLCPIAAMAITPESSRAVILAAQTGEVIGAVSVCGMSEDRIVLASRNVMHRIRDLAAREGEMARAQASHERAVRAGADRVARAGPEACRAAIDRSRALELDRR